VNLTREDNCRQENAAMVDTTQTERVDFDSSGDTLVGDLHLPAGPAEGLPGVVVAGSWTTVKEQMASRYAAGLAARGIPALTFDFRGYGESGGRPRDYESPERKAADINSAIGYLATRPEVDAGRLGALGVCAGSGYIVVNAAGDQRVRSLGLVAPWLHNAELVAPLYGGPEAVAQKIAAGRQARGKYERTGEVDYVPAVSTEDESAAMYGPFEYYLDSQRGAIPQWGNEFAVMAWPEWLEFDPLAIAPQVTAPTLIVHSEDGAVPDGAKIFHDTVAGPCELQWTSGTQFDFYDNDETVSTALDAVARHFRNTL
jgi:uncharacterized protein